MATDAADPKASKSPAHEAVSDADSDANSSDSDSIAGDSLAQQPIEWLATARSKRSTAGNRMKSMLANETPADEDSDLELLFQEDEDDEGFTDKEADDGSDAQMESSDDEDENAAQDDLEGEKELERQAKEKKAAARKRKAQEAIPAKFRKKVRISQPPDTPTSTTAPRPPPRPKKKSERASWLPTEADRPTRASERKTTRLSKEQLHQQMIEREARRMKQLEIMEKKAKKLEAMKKPPMTQADRLREAAVVEKRNSKSLNRWEEAEKQREEERRAKLAALNNRRLEGPVVTFWTGIIDLSEVQLKHVGKMVSIEEKPKPKRKRPSTAVSTAPEEAKTGTETETGQTTAVGTATTSPKPENGPPEPAQATPLTQDAAGTPSVPETPREANEAKAESTLPTPMDVTMSEPVPPASVAGASSIPSSLPAAPVSIPEVSTKPLIPSQLSPPPVSQPISPAVALSPSTTTSATTPTPAHQVPSVPVQSTGLTPPITSPIIKTETQTQQKKIPLALMPDVGPRFMPPPNPHLAQTSQSSVTGIVPGSMPTPVFAPAPVVPVARPVSLTAPTAPPPVLSPVNPLPSHPSSTPTPPAMPSPVAAIPGPSPPPNQQPPAVHTTASFQPVLPPKTPAIPVKKPQTDQGTSKKTAKSAASRKPPPPPEPPEPEPPLEGKVTRSCIILQDFDEDAIKKPEVQTQILFGRKMNKLAKPPHPPLCVITNHPARYRDPKTGLPYYNKYAYNEIQKLTKGDFKWSKLLGTWVGNGSEAAQGVPDRFLRPETEEEHKERLERQEKEKRLAEEEEKKKAEEEKKKKAEEAAKPLAEVKEEAPGPVPTPAPPAMTQTPAIVTVGPPQAAMPMVVSAPAPASTSPSVPPPVPEGVPAIMPSPDDSKPANARPVATPTPVPGGVPASEQVSRGNPPASS